MDLALAYIARSYFQLPSFQTHYAFRSTKHDMLVIPNSKTKFGERFFSRQTNSLEHSANFCKPADFIAIFKSRLTTNLYGLSYNISTFLSKRLCFQLHYVYGTIKFSIIIIIIIINFFINLFAVTFAIIVIK